MTVTVFEMPIIAREGLNDFSQEGGADGLSLESAEGYGANGETAGIGAATEDCLCAGDYNPDCPYPRATSSRLSESERGAVETIEIDREEATALLNYINSEDFDEEVFRRVDNRIIALATGRDPATFDFIDYLEQPANH